MLLKTNRIYLRFLRKPDAKRVFAAVDESRKELSRFLDWPRTVKSPSDSEQFIKTCQANRRDHKAFDFGIFDRKTRSYLGQIDLRINRRNNSAEIGYWMRTSASGRGIITECSALLIDFGFRQLKLNKIVLRAATDNIGSNRIAEKLRFTFEGIQRQEIKALRGWLDLNFYSLLTSEYKTHRKVIKALIN